MVLWQKNKHLLETGKKAKAIIFKNNSGSNTGGSAVYYPVVRFLTDKQEWITQELSAGHTLAQKEGTKVDVIYDPDDPTNVEINSLFQLKIRPGIFIVTGFCGLVVGILELLDITQVISNE